MRISDWSSDVCSSDLHALRTEAVVELPARLARLRHFDQRGTEAEAVAEEDILLVEASRRDIFAKRARGIEQRRLAQIFAPPVIMVGWLMMDRLVDAAMHRPVGLVVPRQPHRPNGPRAGRGPPTNGDR